MASPELSSGWLTHDVARALAATSPPLTATDVVRAANELAAHAEVSVVIAHLLQHDSDPLTVKGIVETLRALQCLAE